MNLPNLPHEELLCPLSVREGGSEIVVSGTMAAAFGKSKRLDDLCRMKGLEHLWISGVDERAARIVGELTGLRRLVIHGLRIPDLRPLAQLTDLQEFAIAGSPKLKSLSGLDTLRNLRSLILFDNCNYSDVEILSTLDDLETLCLEGGFSKQLRLPTLAPLRKLNRLKCLRLASVKVFDGSLRPLHDLQRLRQVFIAKAFSPGEFRALASALPETRGEFVDSFRAAG